MLFFSQPVFQHKDWLPFVASVQATEASIGPAKQRSQQLQQVLPHIDIAVYSSRDAVLQQGAKLEDFVRTSLAPKMEGIEATLNALAQGQIRGAQLVAEQLGMSEVSQFYSLQTEANFYSLSADPSPLFPFPRCHAALEFSSRRCCDCWPASLCPNERADSCRRLARVQGGNCGGASCREARAGVAGSLEAEPKQRTAWCRRKVIVDEVLHLIYTGLSPATAVAELEVQRGSQSLPKLHDSFLALQRQRRSIQERPRA